jgi:methionyl-tRNA synthetase
MEKPRFYITTPIYYPSANAHIGHGLTTVLADAMTRYKKMRGFDTRFLTGMDEHGQKIAKAAAAAGKSPQRHVDDMAVLWQNLWRKLMIENDDFIRTTESRHMRGVAKLFQAIYEKGDIYLSHYQGWYCVSCETYFTERQVGENHVCPDCGKAAEIIEEESYFFRMSKYQDRLLDYIAENPDFIQPVSRRNEMVNFVKSGLEDLCISRTSFDWGIPVPINEKHVIYVWFDALSNYITALGYGSGDTALYDAFWPADIHLMAKDIIRFHAVIWPIILMAADIPLPKKVFGHGWVLLDSGKMSKSKGNVVDPQILIEKYGVAAIRYFLLREIPSGQDGYYSEAALVQRVNIDLANDYGNLVSRSVAMMEKYFGGLVPEPGSTEAIDRELETLAAEAAAEAAACMDKLDFANGLAAAFKLISRANKYIDETTPWILAKTPEGRGRLATVMTHLLEAVRIATMLLAPAMPNIPPLVWAQTGHDAAACQDWGQLAWGATQPGQKVKKGENLFPRILWQDEDAGPEAVAAAATPESVPGPEGARPAALPETVAPAPGPAPAPESVPGPAGVRPAVLPETAAPGPETAPGPEGARPAALPETAAPGPEAVAAAATPESVPGPEGARPAALIDYETFAQIDLRVADILSCQPIPKADKLLRLEIAIGQERRTLVAGIAQHYKPEELVGRKIVVVANLKPAKLRGVESQGMLLAADGGSRLEVLTLSPDIPSGAKVR